MTLLIYLTLCFQPLETKTVNQIADGIKKVEGSLRVPYGIETIPLKGKTKKAKEVYARKICINSINNNWERYNKAGKSGDFLVFMNRRYCPKNMNWSVNLRSILMKWNFDFNKTK